MFGQISPNDRKSGRIFGQTRNHGAHTAPGADCAKQPMKTCNTSFLLKNGLLFCNESDRGNRVEPSAYYFWAEGSDKGPSAQYLRPNLEPIYHHRVAESLKLPDRTLCQSRAISLLE